MHRNPHTRDPVGTRRNTPATRGFIFSSRRYFIAHHTASLKLKTKKKEFYLIYRADKSVQSITHETQRIRVCDTEWWTLACNNMCIDASRRYAVGIRTCNDTGCYLQQALGSSTSEDVRTTAYRIRLLTTRVGINIKRSFPGMTTGCHAISACSVSVAYSTFNRIVRNNRPLG